MISSSDSEPPSSCDMADEERTSVYEYIFCQENEKFTSMFDLPRGTSWISLWSGSYPKLANMEDVYINVTGKNNSSHRYLSYIEFFEIFF